MVGDQAELERLALGKSQELQVAMSELKKLRQTNVSLSKHLDVSRDKNRDLTTDLRDAVEARSTSHRTLLASQSKLKSMCRK